MGKTALIIDDNKPNRDVLQLALKLNGVGFLSLDNPRLIEKTLNEHGSVDVVFLDLEFPNHDGMTWVKTLKQFPALQGVPIIAYTVHTSEIDVARAAGFDGFLGKPLEPKRFGGQLARILNGESVWDAEF